MELQKFISDMLEGQVCVLSFDNVAFGPDKDITSSALSALNFARLAFAAERSTPVLSKILALLCSRKLVEMSLAICCEWSSDVRLQIGDVYHIPLFEGTLKLVSTDYDTPTTHGITRLLENLRHLNSSAALLIAHYSDVISCLRLRKYAQEVFVLFNPQATSEHGRVPSLTFSTSAPEIVQRICEALSADKIHLSQEHLDRQTKLLETCAGHVFVSGATAHGSRTGEDSLILASLTLLTLRSELEELARDNDDLKHKKQRLQRNIVDLDAQLEQERTRSVRSSNPFHGKTARSVPVIQGPQLTQSQPSYLTGERTVVLGEGEMDPSISIALQLQATFDTENDFLLKQKHELMHNAQRQYHCSVCLDDFPEDDAVRIDACGHEICRDCAHGLVCIKIEEHRFPVLCPVCMEDRQNPHPGTISGALVQLLGVSEKQWEIWVEMELAQFSIPFTCRRCQHSAFIDKQDLEANPEIHCPFPACDHVWCKKCQQTIDPNGPKHSCDGTSELDHLMKQQGWRYCPNCKTPIQKTHGCNHLSCVAPGCNTHFCYRCGETINRTAIPREISDGKTAHFRTCPLV